VAIPRAKGNIDTIYRNTKYLLEAIPLLFQIVGYLPDLVSPMFHMTAEFQFCPDFSLVREML
jgi:hypothetical protein